jgi:hypothetical protein
MIMAKPFNPKSTIFTNLMLDEIMPSLSGNAWKVICFAMRKTAGWADASTESGRKEKDIISLSQFEEGCGIAKHTAIDAIEECMHKGYLLRSPSGQSYIYRLNIDFELGACAEIAQANIDPTCKETAQVTCAEIAHTNNNINNKDIRRTSETEKQAILEAMQRGAQKHQNGDRDLSWLGDQARPLGEAFLQAGGDEYYPMKQERSLWYKELNVWAEMGIPETLIADAVAYMRKENLTIGGVQSLTKILRDLKARYNHPQIYQPELEVYRKGQ